MKRILPLVLLLAGPAAADEASPPCVSGGPLSVTTEGGVVDGVTCGATEQWRGIPYAGQPERWRPPGPTPQFISPRSGADFGAACLQYYWWNDELVGSEDCLFLNVTRPAGTAPGAGLPVMVHLHGGGNTFGEAARDARALVADGVIVVTLNYRLDVFGFLAHRQLTVEGGGASGNYGLMDQIAALGWVRRNIGAFGGDPANVTLFGVSAGAMDALGLLVSPAAQGLFDRVALHAVANFAVYGSKDLPHMETVGDEIAEIVGCDTAADVPACLRGLSARTLLQATIGWSVDTPVDGKIVPAAPATLLAQGAGAKPLLLGSGREEASWTLFRLWDLYPDMSYGNWVEQTKDWVGVEDSLRARRLYQPAAGQYAEAVSTLATDLIYTCPVRTVARAHAGSAPTYRYLFTHGLVNDPLGPVLGAIHGTDDLFLWGFDVEGMEYVPTDEERGLASDMARWFTSFARTGAPTPGDPEAWPAYDGSTESILEIDTTSAPRPGGERNAACDVVDTFALWPTCNSRCRKDTAGELPGWFFRRYLFIW